MRKILVVTVMLLSVVALPLAANAQNAAKIASIHQKVAGALAIIRYKYADDTGSRTISGLGICIDNGGGKFGTFMTLAMDARLPEENLKDFEVVIPGVEGKALKAVLLGVDAVTGIGFVRATEERSWPIVAFSAQSNAKIGQEIVSVGALTADLGHAICMGFGRISSVVRVPGKLVYVSGGKLSGIGSPVFDLDARAIGIVGRQQLFLSFQTATQRGPAPLPLKGVQETSFFLPVEEFVDALMRIQDLSKKIRLPWMGVLKFDGVTPALAELVGLKGPGVSLGQIVPDSPADKAGLKERDIIVQVDGKPLERLATSNLTARNFVRKMLRVKIGTVVALTIYREKKIVKDPIKVKLEAMPLRPSEAKRLFAMELGVGMREKVPMDFHIGRGATANVKGMVVIQLTRDGPAHRAGVKIGDLVTSVNEHYVTAVDDVKKAVKQAVDDKTKATVKLLIRRGDKALPILVQIKR